MGVYRTGKPSKTGYDVVEIYPSATLLSVFPETGRRHQIRVHFYHSGHPVLGDMLYGQDRPVGAAQRLMLHATSLTVLYPENRVFSVSAPVSDEWESVIMQLRAVSGKRMLT
jgi:23S rRNA-/tRNA-specific pseudouridylate synthase